MPLPKISVGSDIVYHCSKCKLELGHRIVAMMGNEPARVRCNTCYSERNYRRAKPPADPNPRVRASSAPRPKLSGRQNEEFYHQKLKEAATRTDIPYRIDISPALGDPVQHKVFGRGVVLKLIPPDRVDIIFKDQVRTLACKIVPPENS
ncbi:MAG: hypothetical protein COV44_04605 [Deltaproteobacteria bacterium CG11_big_fil_rev_8_21_14_0_20_45_16]|nr:MAG: hypothetical protein COV44_04605 [Deltaproteobacteria bacterium CG11_big_fil_rev_8_21_14_0_20_45_16]